MAAPIVQGRASGATTTTNTTSHSITLPTGITAGELLLVVFSSDGAPTCTPSAGWTKLHQASQSTVVTQAVFTKIAAGSDTLTVTTSASEQSSHVSYRISGAAYVICQAAVANSTNSNPPSATDVKSADHLFIATRSGDSTVVATVAPSGYSNLQTQAAAGSGGASTNTAEKSSTASTTEDPGTFTSATNPWVAMTLMVSPDANANIDSISDNFDNNSLDAPLTNWGGAQVVETNQQLEITVPNATADYYGVQVNSARYNFQGRQTWVNLKSISDVTPDELEVEFQVLCDNSPTADRVFFLVGNSTITAYKRLANIQTSVASATYNSTNHQWLRIRESGGTVYWEVASQAQYAANNWQAFGNSTSAYSDNFRYCYPILDAGAWDTTHGQVVVVYDNFNVAPNISFTQTHTTDALKRKAITVSHTTDANKKVAGLTKTHTTDAYAHKTYTASHTTDSYLRKAYPTVVNFNGSFEDYPTTNTAATNTGARWIDGTAAGSTTRIWYWAIPGAAVGGTANAQFDTSVKHSGNASLRLTNPDVSSSITVATFRSNPPTSTQLSQEEGFVILPSQTYRVEGWIKTNNAATNAAFIDFRQYNSSGTALTTTSSTKLSGTNDWTKVSFEVTTQATAAYGAVMLRNNVTGNISDVWYDDLRVVAVYTKTHTTDALKRKAITKTHTTDANKKKSGLTVTHTTSANKRVSGITVIHTTNSLKRAQTALTHSTDSFVRKAGITVTHTTDANKRKAGITVSHTTDANKKVTGNTKSHTTDTLKHLTSTLTHTTDAYLQKPLPTIYAFNGNFEDKPATNTAATNTATRWINGTAGGSTTQMWYWSIPGSGIASSAAAQFDSTVSHSGTTSMRLSTLDATGTIVVANFRNNPPTALQMASGEGIPVAASQTYRIKAWIKTNNVATNGAFVDFRQFASDGTAITTTSSTKLSGTNDWTQVTFEVTTQPTAAYASFLLRNSVTGNVSDAWFDDITISPVYTKTHSTSANKRKATTVTHTTNAVKRAQVTKTHTTDAFKHVAPTVSHTTDANKKKSGNTVSHTTNSYLGAPTGGNKKIFNGSSWVSKPVKVLVAGVWTVKPVKFYNGSSWVNSLD